MSAVKIEDTLRKKLKTLFDGIGNEKMKLLLLQAFPFWLASFITGLAAVGYTKLFQWSEHGAAWVFHQSKWWLLISTPACFLTAVWIVKRFAPLARGSGIPQVAAAIEMSTPSRNALVDRLLNLPILFVKILSSCLMALGGAVVGREGPTIQIAASVFRKVNTLLPAWWPKISKRNMIMTGAAAGLAAAFNTPLGGIVFAMEELSRSHISLYRTAIFSAVIIAGLTAQALLGPYLYLGYPNVTVPGFVVFLVVAAVALFCGMLSALMAKTILRLLRWKATMRSRSVHWAWVIGCAWVVALIGIVAGYQHLNSGKEVMTDLLFTQDKFVSWYTPLLRIIGSAASFVSGAAGGIFAPALSSGATIGSVVSHLLSLSPAATDIVILAGMVGFLTGITRSPFTSAILVLEMTNGHGIIFHLMLAAMTANLSAYFIDKHSFYDHLKTQYMREVEAVPPQLNAQRNEEPGNKPLSS